MYAIRSYYGLSLILLPLLLQLWSCSSSMLGEGINREIASQPECLREGDYCKLRDLFRESRAPAHKELRIKKKWICCDDLNFSENCTTRIFYRIKEYGKQYPRYQVFERLTKDTTSVSHISDKDMKSSLRRNNFV